MIVQNSALVRQEDLNRFHVVLYGPLVERDQEAVHVVRFNSPGYYRNCTDSGFQALCKWSNDFSYEKPMGILEE